ncbi:hypothetical protein GGTG_08633 [Gaeumannomyces tritici R3-111a-1]|uniref:Uncharacterized protein n=1 Tax=Gaeumannomyces tritici (strain R3-111a-1) TaxID=644352 RepID=J3P547_GAET3|nr:hypothetical protein GGTG_08633 [Gaeumannomyces tritici R3-111a-1]EJT74795.1 hypothetical protein GGTG_08633 [Gaeumannomyces tritici R3-111a-1]
MGLLEARVLCWNCGGAVSDIAPGQAPASELSPKHSAASCHTPPRPLSGQRPSPYADLVELPCEAVKMVISSTAAARPRSSTPPSSSNRKLQLRHPLARLPPYPCIRDREGPATVA